MPYPPREGDLPFEEIVEMAGKILVDGGTFWVKFTCVHCGSRQICGTANSFFTGGYSCEACGETTHPQAYGLAVAWAVRVEDT